MSGIDFNRLANMTYTPANLAIHTPMASGKGDYDSLVGSGMIPAEVRMDEGFFAKLKNIIASSGYKY